MLIGETATRQIDDVEAFRDGASSARQRPHFGAVKAHAAAVDIEADQHFAGTAVEAQHDLDVGQRGLGQDGDGVAGADDGIALAGIAEAAQVAADLLVDVLQLLGGLGGGQTVEEEIDVGAAFGSVDASGGRQHAATSGEDVVPVDAIEQAAGQSLPVGLELGVGRNERLGRAVAFTDDRNGEVARDRGSRKQGQVVKHIEQLNRSARERAAQLVFISLLL